MLVTAEQPMKIRLQLMGQSEITEIITKEPLAYGGVPRDKTLLSIQCNSRSYSVLLDSYT